MSAELALQTRPEAQTVPNGTDAATTLLSVTSRLIGVLEREIEMLRGMKPREMQSIQHDKIVLAAAYEAAVRDLNADEAAVASITPAVRAELAEATERFQSALQANERALRAAKDATDRLLKHIVSEAERQRGQASAYGARAGKAVAVPAGSALSLSVDQRL
jgi:flagellar biosynthesis/type III secretory pathway chaperone